MLSSFIARVISRARPRSIRYSFPNVGRSGTKIEERKTFSGREGVSGFRGGKMIPEGRHEDARKTF